MMNKFYCFVITFLFAYFAFSQNTLLDEITSESDYKNTFEMPAFKAMKVVNNQSTKLAGKSDLYLYVGRPMDNRVLTALKDTKSAQNDFNRLEENRSKLSVIFILIYLIIRCIINA